MKRRLRKKIEKKKFIDFMTFGGSFLGKYRGTLTITNPELDILAAEFKEAWLKHVYNRRS